MNWMDKGMFICLGIALVFACGGLLFLIVGILKEASHG